MRLARRDLQGIEIGFQMADDAIGAHQLDGADGILGDGAGVLAVGGQRPWPAAGFRRGGGLAAQRDR